MSVTRMELRVNLVRIKVVTGTGHKDGDLYINPSHMCIQATAGGLLIHNGDNLYVDPDFAKNFDEFCKQMLIQGVRL